MRYRILGRGIGAMVMVGVLAAPAFAQAPSQNEQQDKNRVDVGVSYALVRDTDAKETLPFGWVAAGAFHLSDTFAGVGEVSGSYDTISNGGTDFSFKVHSFLAGVRLTGHGDQKVIPFGQVLIGATCFCGTDFDFGVVRSTGFTVQPGGGVDYKIKPNLAVRGQVDLRYIHQDGDAINQFRFAAGLVFRVK